MQGNSRTSSETAEKLNASSEDYLKAVYHFSQKTEFVQSAEIAVYLGVTRPSVHRAMEILQEAGLIVKPLYGEISLTEKGYRQAQVITCKHKLLTWMLLSLHVDEKTAAEDACRMEHIISDETMHHLMQCFEREYSEQKNSKSIGIKAEKCGAECVLAENQQCAVCWV